MVFDFAAQPPELISAKIYSGPGASSLQSAATAWDGLAGELQSTAANYQSVIAGLVSADWTGPSSEAAAAAAAPYVSWLSTTAGQAEQSAAQARAAASAYEAALAAAVPPTEILANRTQLLSLLQTNILGQNNAAIAAAEAEYAQFWAQDVAAITGYAGSSQAATSGLGSFTAAPQTTNDSGQATQAAATAARRPPRRQSLLSRRSSTRSRPIRSPFRRPHRLNSTYTHFLTRAIGRVHGGHVYSVPGDSVFDGWASALRPPLLTSPMALPALAFRSGRTSAFIRRGPPEAKSRWTAGWPLRGVLARASEPGRIGGFGQRADGGQVVGAAELGRRPPAIRLAATSLPDGAFAATAASRQISAEPAQPEHVGQLDGRRARQPGLPRCQLDRRPAQGVRSPASAARGRSSSTRSSRNCRRRRTQVQHWSVDEAGLDELVAKLSTNPGIHAVHLTDEEGRSPGRKF